MTDDIQIAEGLLEWNRRKKKSDWQRNKRQSDPAYRKREIEQQMMKYYRDRAAQILARCPFQDQPGAD